MCANKFFTKIFFIIIFFTIYINGEDIDCHKGIHNTNNYQNIFTEYVSILLNQYASEMRKYYSGFEILITDLHNLLIKSSSYKTVNEDEEEEYRILDSLRNHLESKTADSNASSLEDENTSINISK